MEGPVPRSPIDPGARERLLDATDRLLARHGFRRMTVAQVAEAAGVGKGSVYLHFDSKQALALGCLDRMATRVLDRLRAIADGPGGPRTRLRDMLRTRVLDRFDYARRHAPSIDQKLAVMRQEMLARRNRHFAAEADVLESHLRAHGLHPDPAAAARALVTATNALLPYSLSVAELGHRERMLERLDELLDLLLDAVSPAVNQNRRESLPRRTR
jgi:AcrR family transcriptional regulator